MTQQSAVEALLFLQFMGFAIVFLEKSDLKNQLKTAPLKVKAGRLFMFLLPTITLISILVKPLEG